MTYLTKIDDPSDLRRLPLAVLPDVCDELRAYILETISKVGGHLGASLGTVELTVAIHYVFESPTDRIIWDVGHQAHGHKILTGRRDTFPTLKQEGGLSGFLKRSESDHDIFGAGHASTSISAALGVLEGMRLKDNPGKSVAVIGDGGLTGGMAFEALNSAGGLKRDLIVVLNDNGMSISPNVGGVSDWVSHKLTDQRATMWRKRVRAMLEVFDGAGERAIRVVEAIMGASKALILSPGSLFESMGFEYVGPVDGHDVGGVVETLKNARQLERPVLVHALTSKGKGCPGVDTDVERKHAVKPFDLQSGKSLVSKPTTTPAPTYTGVFGDTLCKIARTDARIVAITAAMPQGTGLIPFAKEFPGRFHDVGIAEQHAVTFAAGLAIEGFRPVAAIYSTFLQRAFDQVIHDVCLQDLPVIFCMDRGGLVGADGPTHHGVFDLSFMRIIPKLALMAPKDENELQHMLATAIASSHPIAIRYPRGNGIGVKLDDVANILPWGQGEVLLEEGSDLLVIAAGPLVYDALNAAKILNKDGVRSTVINARFIKPLDEKLLIKHLSMARNIITLEENALQGGFGSAVLELCSDRNISVNLRRLGIPDHFMPHGNVASLLKTCGLDVEGIVKTYNEMNTRTPTLSIASKKKHS